MRVAAQQRVRSSEASASCAGRECSKKNAAWSTARKSSASSGVTGTISYAVGSPAMAPILPWAPGRCQWVYAPERASRIGTSLASDSATSDSGSEPATMPQPAKSRRAAGLSAS